MTESVDDREGFAALMLRMRGIGIAEPQLFSALEATPRRGFVPPQWQEESWRDGMFPIACGEAMEGIDLQTRALAALDLQPGVRVLEVGTGTGFTAAVMARIAARVLSIDRYRTLATEAAQRLAALGLENVIIRHGDAIHGAPADGPFDRILVWASFESMPRTFVDQLASGGIMVAPIGPGDGLQTLAKLSRLGSRFEREDIMQVRLQPLTSGLSAHL